jgi:hypothetical protein
MREKRSEVTFSANEWAEKAIDFPLEIVALFKSGLFEITL